MRPFLLALFVLAACDGGDADDTTPMGDDDDDVALTGDPDFERDPALNVDLQSEAGSTLSHNNGLACMHCHQPNGSGRGLFTAAGSVYRDDDRPAAGGAVQLWAGSADGGTLLLELPVDAFGNFYTTADLGLPDVPIQPVVIDEDGLPVNQMPWPTESGSCNQCHTPGLRVRMP